MIKHVIIFLFFLTLLNSCNSKSSYFLCCTLGGTRQTSPRARTTSRARTTEIRS